MILVILQILLFIIECVAIANVPDRISDANMTETDRVNHPYILKTEHEIKYGGSTRYGPGNHEGDPAYDRTKSFNSWVAGLGLGKCFRKRRKLNNFIN